MTRIQVDAIGAVLSQQEAKLIGASKLRGHTGYPECKVSEDLMALLIATNTKFTAQNCIRELTTPAGKADIVTPKAVIEVKKGSDYKHALGQVLFYKHHLKKVYPKIAPAVALYDVNINLLGVIVGGYRDFKVDLYVLYDKKWYFLPWKA